MNKFICNVIVWKKEDARNAENYFHLVIYSMIKN